MLRIAGQTTEPNGLKFFVDTQGFPGGVLGYKKIFHGQRRALHLVLNKSSKCNFKYFCFSFRRTCC